MAADADEKRLIRRSSYDTGGEFIDGRVVNYT